jgi:hypothetical protein
VKGSLTVANWGAMSAIPSLTVTSFASSSGSFGMLASATNVVTNALVVGTDAGSVAQMYGGVNFQKYAIFQQYDGQLVFINSDAMGNMAWNGTTLALSGNEGGDGSDPSCVSVGFVSLHQTNGVRFDYTATAPANTTTVRGWIAITAGGAVYKMPLYQ